MNTTERHKLYQDFLAAYPHAGKFRDYDITKKEWILRGATVTYGMASELKATVEYDLDREKQFNYSGLSESDIRCSGFRHKSVCKSACKTKGYFTGVAEKSDSNIRGLSKDYRMFQRNGEGSHQGFGQSRLSNTNRQRQDRILANQ